MNTRGLQQTSRFVFYALVFSFTVSACGGAQKMLSPDTHRDAAAIPQAQMIFGNAYAYEHKIRGDILLARNDLDGAVDEYEKAIVGSPDDSSLHIQLATVLLQKKQPERARVHIAEAILMSPGNGEAWCAAAEYHLQQNDTEKAIESATMGYQSDRTDISSLVWLAEYYSRRQTAEQKKRALQYYQLALIRCRTQADIFFAAATVSYELQYTELSVQYYIQYLALRGENFDAVQKIAKEYERSQQTSAAVSLYFQILAQHHQDDSLRKHLIVLLLKTRRNREAVRQIFSINQFPSDPEDIVERTNWLIHAHALWDARQLIIENFSGAPTHPAVRLQLAKIETALGRTEIASLLLTYPTGEWPSEYRNDVQKVREATEQNKYQYR
ncbi:MAG: hypothetical protein JXX29_10645 [Deltaproteobacteria bacterium]|nr:hypothetical protein [Deltaproteobacteria bacterium]MBN2672126.1 hypothetical protein [Deltaproteobacteria bacterium]